jgi:serine/threonine kinase PknH
VSSPRSPQPWRPSTPEDRFGEPAPNDDDTGPLHVPAPPPFDDSTWDLGPDDDPWWRRFETPLEVNPRPVRRDRKRIVLLGVVVLFAVVAFGGLALWQLRSSPAAPSSHGTDTTASTTASASADPEAQAQLLRLLPAGYPSDSCKPVAAAEDVLAEVNCEKNSDAGGPLSATYTLVSDKAALDAALGDIVRASTRVNCPGNIQSPGPWRRNATPQKTSGVLFCGIQQSRPTVAWTDDDDLLVSTVQSGPQGPTLDQLYAWWSSHS